MAPAPVLLVHGVRTSHTMWRAQVEALERLGHRVLAIDLPGHGTRIEERFTLEAATEAVHAGVRELAGTEVGGGSPGAADIEARVRPPGAARPGVDNGSVGAGVANGPARAGVGKGSARAGVDNGSAGAGVANGPARARVANGSAGAGVVVRPVPVVVVGLSLGAYVALHAVARDETGVGAVVAAGCCTVPTSAVLHGWALLARGIVAMPDGGAALNRRLAELTLPRQAVEDLAAGGFALKVMDDVLREVAQTRPLEDLAAIGRPVWLVNGRFDHFRTRERAFVRAGRDVRLRVVPRAKHLVSLDQPVRFTRIVLEAAAAVEERAALSSSSAGRPRRAPSRS